jgi:hypothetical protein
LAGPIAAVIGIALTDALAADEALPNLAGTYQCEALRGYCERGKVFTVTQNGQILSVQNDTGVSGTGTMLSHITINLHYPWNMTGVILRSDNNNIQWSNGTRWRKQ